VSHSVTVIGTGYVGLVTGACLADLGHHVVCLDVDAARVALLQAGEIPIYEPGLDDVVARGIAAGHLEFTTDVAAATQHGDYQIIAVGTPQAEDGAANVSYVYTAARNIGTHVTRPVIVIDKSTVPVGTGDQVRELINAELERRGVDVAVSVVSNPEFLKEGAAIDDLMHPDRIVVGVSDAASAEKMASLYADLIDTPDRMLVTDVRSAELIKYAANAMLATRISFMNELARLAELLGANIDDVKMGMGSDARIGSKFLNAGVGYGGSCFPKDVQALIHTAHSNGMGGLRILEAVEEVNASQKTYLLDKLEREFPDVSALTVAVWGLAFKPHTDDVRDATSVTLLSRLVNQAARIQAYDPVATEAFQNYTHLPSVIYSESAEAALEGADVLLILTEWPEFSAVDPSIFATMLAQKTIFDGRNIFALSAMEKAGVTYHSIGRPSVG
jgi:UDPglucose 6-dehydrogenase